MTASNLESSYSPHSTEANDFVLWLRGLIVEHGPGEYLIIIRADGAVTVKRPQKPLQFEWR